MEIDITLKNYRCFPDSSSPQFTLRKGFTAFIGVNNSGKSSLLKFFYEFRPLFRILSSPDERVLHAIRGIAQGFGVPSGVFDIEELFSNQNNRDIQIEIEVDEARPNRLVITVPRGTSTWVAKPQVLGADLDPSSLKFVGTTLNYRNGSADLSAFFSACKILSETLYIGPFRNAINVGTNADYFDIRVGLSFIEAWREYKTGKIKKHSEAAYRLSEDIKRIFGFNDFQIDASADGQTLQLLINGKPFKLTEVGSGITQFILVLANAAIRQPSFILIDEPELNLHPFLQLDFLTTLASYAQEGILFGTQSIGLARASADKIYTLRCVVEGESRLVPLESIPRLSEFLGELSFSGYREIGFDKILLVEGVTDVKTAQQLLRFYRKDHKVVVLPLGGTQFITGSRETELQEIKRISENIYALIDSERTASNDELDPTRRGFAELCQKVGIKCHVLKYRAIENYLSDRAIKKVKGDKYKALQPYQALKESQPAWAKSENWRMAREMIREELDDTDLGEFLSSL